MTSKRFDKHDARFESSFVVKPSPAFPTFAAGPIARLAALAPLTVEDVDALRRATITTRRIAACREIVREGARSLEPSVVLEGWAARVRNFPDGRRQILGLLLPGELIGACRHKEPLAATTIIALTPVTLCPLPDAAESEAESGLPEAYALSSALEEFQLFRHIARLGRLSAYERLLDWLLEMHDRLALSDLAAPDNFPMPLTQETLADALGLTSVHVNRTIQLMRREGLIVLHGGIARLNDRKRLETLVDYRPSKVSALRD